ncbi:MAG: cation diffusion facilitator family transporter [Alphaproteobacteria bacterium]|jgi:ferrous-iron efflux pump FieF|nr:cation diffusion facilitator family transporter [Alphaproteobacteria bacterium]
MSMSAENGRLMRRAAYASVTVALLLIVLKLGAWLTTSSVAILSSLIDSVLDAFASIINLIAVRHALAPADEEHRFGHGKAESIAGLGQAAFIAGSAVFLIFESIARLVTPQEVSHGDIGIAVMVISVLLTAGLVRYQMHVVRKTGSTAIGADSLHYRADLLVNLAIIGSLVASTFGGAGWMDPVVAIFIALYILHGAAGIGRISLDALMDREFLDEDRQRIIDISLAHDGVRGVHDLRTRRSGLQPFIQLHLELSASMSLHDAHVISDEVEAAIMEAFPGAEVIIHQDPDDIVEPMPHFARK